MALYIPHSIFHLARLLYVRPETFGPNYVTICTKYRSLRTSLKVYLFRYCLGFFPPMALQFLVGHVLLIFETSPSDTTHR